MKGIVACFLIVSQWAFAEEIQYREPFTLKLPVDNEHYYQQMFEATPFVSQEVVFLFMGDHFGINLQKGENLRISFQKNLQKADVEFSFTQELIDEKLHMILSIKNNTKEVLYMEGLLTRPDKKVAVKTSILPVNPGLTNIESWPHPIIQLALRNIHLENM